MHKAPKISICGSAYRPQNWMALYNSIGYNDIDFEIVFVGPNPPRFPLPGNFRFIRSMVKPTQCNEIAFRNSTGDLVMNIADDCYFKSSRPLDRLYETYRTYNNDKLLLSCRYMLNGEVLPERAHRLVQDDMSSPVAPLAALMSKTLFSDLGGIDSNFVAVQWDLDIAMRVYALGGDVILSDVFLNEDHNTSAGSALNAEYFPRDRTFLESLWISNGKFHLNRTNPVKPFSDMNILNASQGPRGRWRGNGPVILEKIVDRLNLKMHLVKYGPLFRAACRAMTKPSRYPYHFKKRILRLKGKL